MKDNDEVIYWTGKGHGVGMSSRNFEKYRVNAGLSTAFYQDNHKKISKFLNGKRTVDKKVEFIKVYLYQLLNNKIHFESQADLTDLNGFNPNQIANELLIDFTKEQLKTYLQLQKLENEHSETEPMRNEVEKLKWLGSPSQFGYLFLELAKKGFIEIPSTNGEASYSRFAKVCWELFSVERKTTYQNLEKEMNPNKNTLSEGVRSKFNIPERDDVSKKNKRTKN